MSNPMKYALCVGGFDGSAGAGVLADALTMAHFGVYAQSVCTALTEQNEDEFVAPGWVIWERIEAQLETLYRKHNFKYVKIGLVEKAKILKRIVEFIRERSPDAFILWDPIASASAGYHFMRDAEQEDFVPVMKMIDLITPNQDEFALLGLGLSASRGELELGRDFAVLLKGGHAKGKDAVDTLWTRDGTQHKFVSPRVPGADKHGTGCHLGSAILANIACGKSLLESCEAAKAYMDEFIRSGEGRLGFVSSSGR
jgi:hydroxymethylpyrimidine/phosphomethylpyrimidine kinase